MITNLLTYIGLFSVMFTGVIAVWAVLNGVLDWFESRQRKDATVTRMDEWRRR